MHSDRTGANKRPRSLERNTMNTESANQNSDNTAPRNLSALLRDAHLLLDAQIEKALSEAGSNRRELRLLRRLENGDNTKRVGMHVERRGSLASTFATRGWIEYAEGAWRLTATGSSEYARLQGIVSDAVTSAAGDASTLTADVSTLVESLGGADAARAARIERREKHHARFERHAGHRHGGEHAPRGTHRGRRSEFRGDHAACGEGRPGNGHGRDYAPHRGNAPYGIRDHAPHAGRDPRSAYRDQHNEQPRPQRGRRFYPGGPTNFVNGEDIERAIRDLGRGLAPLFPFFGAKAGAPRAARFTETDEQFVSRLGEYFGQRAAEMKANRSNTSSPEAEPQADEQFMARLGEFFGQRGAEMKANQPSTSSPDTDEQPNSGTPQA